MKRLFFNVLSLGIIAGLVLTSCEDEFTEEQALEQQRQILEALNNADNANDLAVAELSAENAIAINELDAQQQMAFQMYQDSLRKVGPVVNYAVSVLAAGSINSNARTSGEAFAPGATVTLVQGGVARTETAGDNGVAIFGDLRVGSAIVTASAPDHTTVTYTTSLGSPTSNLAEDNIETTIPLFPTTVAGGATQVGGTVWAKLDATSDSAQVVPNALVRASLSVQNALTTYGISINDFSKGGIQDASYTSFTQVDTTDANGMYSIVVPNGLGDDGDGILGAAATLEFLPIVADQTFVDDQGDTLAVVTKPVRFDQSGTYSHVDAAFPSVFAEISAPGGDAPSGFALGTAVRSTPITSSTFRLVDGGEDYVVGDIFAFPTGVDDDEKAIDEFAYVEVSTVDADGMITGWFFDETAPVGYITDPGVPTPATTAQAGDAGGTEPAGTGASFELLFEANYDVFIANGGSGYTFAPDVSYTVQNVINQGGGNVIATVGDPEIGAGTDNATFELSSLLTEGGEIVINSTVIEANQNNGDTIRTNVGPFASAPTFVVKPIELEAPIVTDVTVNTSGEITGISLDDSDGGFPWGSGYASQPTITFTTVDGLMGSGAAGVVSINDGSVIGVTITNGGSGYEDNVNNTSLLGSFSTGNSITSLEPGETVSNFNYVYTGAVIQE